jgi:hypothetical protein
MNPIDFPASFQNLENMNKIQHKEVTDPLMFAMRNSIEDDKRLEERLHRVNESEEADKSKEINPDEQKKQEQNKKKKDEKKQKNRGLENGRFIDFSV